MIAKFRWFASKVPSSNHFSSAKAAFDFPHAIFWLWNWCYCFSTARREFVAAIDAYSSIPSLDADADCTSLSPSRFFFSCFALPISFSTQGCHHAHRSSYRGRHFSFVAQIGRFLSFDHRLVEIGSSRIWFCLRIFFDLPLCLIRFLPVDARIFYLIVWGFAFSFLFHRFVRQEHWRWCFFHRFSAWVEFAFLRRVLS